MAVPTKGNTIYPTDVYEIFGATLGSGISGGVYGYRIGMLAVISFSIYASTTIGYQSVLFTLPYRAQHGWWAQANQINYNTKRHVYMNQGEYTVRIGNTGFTDWICGQLVVPILA